MAEAIIRVITDPEELGTVADHFQAMYAELTVERGISDEGKANWIAVAKRALDRTLFVHAAEIAGEVVASIHGTLLLSPAHLGSERVAMVQHIYVEPEHRQKGFAQELASTWLEAMKERGISNFQLHVTAGNEAGTAFWKSLGFELELSQLSMRYPIG